MILGMHRSGTSALTRVLAAMGCSLPTTLIGENESNPLGHWESDVVRIVNDRLLDAAGTSWQHWAPVEASFFQSAAAGGLLSTASRALETEFEESPLFVLKDPRLSLLMPFWFEVLDELKISPSIVCAVRYPGEVARSLAHRDLIEESVGQLIWLRHMLEAEATTRGRERVYVCYDQLLNEWPEVIDRIGSTFGISWPRTIESRRVEVGSFLSNMHRHHTFEKGQIERDRAASGWTREVYSILKAWSQQGENAADYARLDVVKAAFDAASAAFAPAVTIAQNALLHERAISLIEDQHKADLAIAEAKFIDMQAYAESLQMNLANAKHSVESILSTEIEADQLKDISEINELKGQLAELQSRMRQRDEELAQTWNELEQAQRRAAETEDLTARLAELSKKLADADDWVFKLAGDRQIAEQARATAERKLEASCLIRDGVLKKLELTTGELSDARKAILSYEAQSAIQIADMYAAFELERLENRSRLEIAGEDRDVALVKLDQAEAQIAEFVVSTTEFHQKLAAAHEELAQLARQIITMNSNFEIERESILNQLQTIGVGAVASQEALAETQSALARHAKIALHIEKAPWWMALLPASYRRKHLELKLKARNLFDAEAYLKNYPDVAASGQTAIMHYLQHGMFEGRTPL